MVMELRTIDIKEIVTQARIRDDLGNIDELAKSIKEYGLICPIMVNKSNVLLSGFRRLQACKKLGISQIQVLVSDTEDTMDIFNIESQENLCRKPLTPTELDKAIDIKTKYAYGKVEKKNIVSKVFSKLSRIFKKEKS